MRLVAIALALLLLAAAGCGDDAEPAGDESPSPEPTEPADTDGDTDDADGEDTDDTDGEGAEEATAYFARIDNSGAWVEPETHELDEPTVGVARAALELAISGEPRNPDLATTAPEGTEVLGVSIADGVLTLDLSADIQATGAGSAQEQAFSQQLAHTAAQFDDVDAVRLHVDGAEITELWGHLDWSQPIEPDLFALTPVTIETPLWGEEVPAGEITAAGQANTFEATVELRLIDPDGEVVEDTFTTATSGTGTRGTWEHTFETAIDEPGEWTIEAAEPDPSGGEGRPPLVTRVEFTVV